MPLYEYKCQTCGERVEVIQRVSDPPYTHCPKCGGEMRKVISAPAIKFKGPGFYKTDYAPKSAETKSETGEKKPETKAEKKQDGSSSE